MTKTLPGRTKTHWHFTANDKWQTLLLLSLLSTFSLLPFIYYFPTAPHIMILNTGVDTQQGFSGDNEWGHYWRLLLKLIKKSRHISQERHGCEKGLINNGQAPLGCTALASCKKRRHVAFFFCSRAPSFFIQNRFPALAKRLKAHSRCLALM